MMVSKLSGALILVILAFGLLAITSGAASVVGSASIRAPAVIIENNTGSLTTINITVYHGTGNVTVTGPAIVGQSTLQSAQTAAQYAAKYLSLNFNNYNFTYTIIGGGNNVSGPSGGVAMTLLAISALSGQHLIKNFTVTGTVSSNGIAGLIGGVYDKTSAAKKDGMNFIIVPAASNDSVEDELYLLTQDTFGIPLVQASNVSQAASYAFGKAPPTKTSVQLYNNYSVSKLSYAPLSCSNGCNESQFNGLVNFTFDFTNASLMLLSNNPNFNNAFTQFQSALAQDRALVQKGYLYAGADQAFLNYIDITFFNSYLTNESQGFYSLEKVYNYCYSLSPPQLTNTNYEYVIGGELRQSWGEFTANSTLIAYNNSVETTDDVLVAMRATASSAAWCSSASEMYSIANSTNGAAMVQGPGLGTLATERIQRAAAYGNNMYLITAEQALAANNFPLAIMEADYAYALSNSSSTSATLGTGVLINMSKALAVNSTYGTWATQFANEAMFYAQEAGFASNASTAHGYAESAYSSALLASQIEYDMQIISRNLVNGTGIPGINNQTIRTTTVPVVSTNSSISPLYMSYLTETTHQIFEIAVAMLAINIVLFFIVLYLLLPSTKYSRQQLKAGSRSTRRRRRK